MQAASYYQRAAYKSIMKLDYESKSSAIISDCKDRGQVKHIQEELTKFNKQYVFNGAPYDLAYCEGELFNQYMHDMQIIQEYATWNRNAMMDTILKAMGLHMVDRFTTIHNYIDTENMILRKGSVSAQDGETLIIPINMRDGSLICIGKGNPDWNYSAPHGAGRLMSRAKAKETFTVSEFKKTMKEAGVYTTSVGNGTLDECPMTYKPIDVIKRDIEPAVEIQNVIKPIYNFKASEM